MDKMLTKIYNNYKNIILLICKILIKFNSKFKLIIKIYK